MLQSLVILVCVSLLAGCSLIGVRSGYEQPSYVLVETLSDQISIRRSKPLLAVETTVNMPDYDEGRGAAFRRLFHYISGANINVQSTILTDTSESLRTSEKISMTAPVETSRNGASGIRMRFFLPAELTLETAPQPTDRRLQLVEVPGQLQAVLRFSGFASEDEVAKNTQTLVSALRKSSWSATSRPLTHIYDPPWTIPFLRRNEIVIPIAPASS
jgi:hypothetical protein